MSPEPDRGPIGQPFPVSRRPGNQVMQRTADRQRGQIKPRNQPDPSYSARWWHLRTHMTPGKLILLFGNSDADALAWRARVNAAGGSVSQATYSAMVKFSRSCKAAGIWDKLNRVNLFCGDQLTAALVPLKAGSGSATDTNVNFVSGDYTEATGLTGNGTTKYLNTGLIPSTALTNNSTHFAIYSRSDATVAAFNGASDGTGAQNFQLYAANGGSAISSDQYNANPAQGRVVSGALTGALGFVIGTRTSISAHNIYRAGIVIASSSSAGGTMPAQAVYLFARNSGGVAANFAVATLAGYSIGTGLTASEVSAYNTIMETFQDALNRGVQ